MPQKIGTFDIIEGLLQKNAVAGEGDYAIVGEFLYIYDKGTWKNSGPAILMEFIEEDIERDGPGIPKDGTVGQVLAKKSNNPLDMEWINSPGAEHGWDEEVSVYADLPAASTVSGQIWLVLNSSGIPLVNYHGKGLYYSDGSVWNYLGEVPANIAWGNINGTLSSQTDLVNALAAKSDATHVHAGLRVLKIAGEHIDAHKIVTVDNAGLGKVWQAYNTELSHAGRVLGLNISEVNTGDVATIILIGEYESSAWNWTVYDSIYLGSDGFLTQTVPVYPASAYSQIIGFPTSPTKMMIRIQEPIILA